MPNLNLNSVPHLLTLEFTLQKVLTPLTALPSIISTSYILVDAFSKWHSV